MQAVLPKAEGCPVQVEPVTDELVRSKLLELLSTQRDSPDFLARYQECDRLIGLAMEQATRGQLR